MHMTRQELGLHDNTVFILSDSLTMTDLASWQALGYDLPGWYFFDGQMLHGPFATCYEAKEVLRIDIRHRGVDR